MKCRWRNIIISLTNIQSDNQKGETIRNFVRYDLAKRKN